MTKTQIGEVIKRTRLAAGFTQSELSRALNRPQQTIANWEVGRSQPDANTLFELFRTLGADINEAFGFKRSNDSPLTDDDWKFAHDYHKLDKWGKRVVQAVIAGELARIEAERRTAQPDISGTEPEEPKIIRFRVPQYREPMSAGYGEAIGTAYAEDVELIKEPPRGTSFVARVSGDSMEPTYHDGDWIFVHSQNEVRIGEVGVFYMDGKEWIKELGSGELISHNPAYEPRRIAEDVRCQGLVLGICDNSYFDK